MKRLWNALSSFWLTCVILLGLMWLTIVGTLAQRPDDLGLFLSQQKYFNSFLVTHEVAGPWRIGDRDFALLVPFPGGQTLLMLLFVNLVCGGMVRIRKSWSRAGILVAHFGIALLLGAGFVKYWMADDGSLRLWEGQQSDTFSDDHRWEIAIREIVAEGQVREHSIPGDRFQQLRERESATFTSAQLPFDLTVTRVLTNSIPRPAEPHGRADGPVVGGFFLRPLALDAEHHERNALGLQATVEHKGTRARDEALLWGRSEHPWVVTVAGKPFEIELRKLRYEMPFTIRLEKTARELHPRMAMAAAYESWVTKVEKGRPDERVHIYMNTPMRHGDFVLFQSGWGPEDAVPGQRLYSEFSVVRNASDQWPRWACFVIALGLLIQFSMKLFSYVRAETRRAAARA